MIRHFIQRLQFSRTKPVLSCVSDRNGLPDGFFASVLKEAWPHDTVKHAARATGRHTRTVDGWIAGAEPGLGDIIALMAASSIIWQRISQQAGHSDASNVILLMHQAQTLAGALSQLLQPHRLPAADHTRLYPPGAVDSAGSERGAAA
ncbi:hypothetical protein [Ferrovibrio terrae]|uniref:hypothetical protein n=1 Tax=Ferrovibrio terrae TaxID=2594003 RepID=UPI003137CA41